MHAPPTAAVIIKKTEKASAFFLKPFVLSPSLAITSPRRTLEAIISQVGSERRGVISEKIAPKQAAIKSRSFLFSSRKTSAERYRIRKLIIILSIKTYSTTISTYLLYKALHCAWEKYNEKRQPFLPPFVDYLFFSTANFSQ